MKKSSIVKILLLLGDVVTTQIALFFTLFLRNRHLLNQFNVFSYHFAILYGLWILILFMLNLYDIHFFKKPIDFLYNVIIFFVVRFGVNYLFQRIFSYLPQSPKTIDAGATYEEMNKKISFDHLDEAWFL